MAEPAHEEEMPDATAGAEQGESKFGEGDKEEPITKTIRIVRQHPTTSVKFGLISVSLAAWFYGECGFF